MTYAFPTDLLDGYSRFRDGSLARQRERYLELATHGQSPDVLVVACCDSRAAPETIFDAAPGGIFVVRNVANLVPRYAPDGLNHSTSAALEYGVRSLGVKHIVVLGHGRCGGVAAALDQEKAPLTETDFIGSWVEPLSSIAEAVGRNSGASRGEKLTLLERQSIFHSVANLRTFPWIDRRKEAGELQLHGAWFDISSGELWLMCPTHGDFHRFDGDAQQQLPPSKS